MSTAKGAKAQIIYGEEQTFNQLPASPAGTLLPFRPGESLARHTGLGQTGVIRANRNPERPFQDTREVSGPIPLALNPYMGLLFKHLLGAVTTTGSGPYTHVFKVADLPTSLWFEKGFTDIGQYLLFTGVRVGSMSFSFSGKGGVVESGLALMGADQADPATASVDPAPTVEDDRPFRNFQAAIEEGGAAIATVTEVSLQVDNNLDGDVYTIGSGGSRHEIPEGVIAVTGELTALFDSVTLYNKARNGTESSLKITLSRGDGLGAAGNESLEIYIPELVFEENTPAVDGPRGLRVKLPFRAYYEDSAEASAVQFTLKNPVPTY